MNLSQVTDKQLLLDAKKWADHERAGLHAVLHHLHEVDRRRLYCSLRYQSLFAYAMGELKYSEDAAVRRISAMRLMKELPQIESKISTGALTLTNLGLAKRLFSKKSHTAAEKLAVVETLENRSTRAAQKIVFEIMPELKRREPTYADFDDDLKAKLEKVRGLLAHKEGDLSLVKLLHKLCDDRLAAKSPAAPRVNQEIRRRDGCCVNCGSVHALEVDHILPKAMGGCDTKKNLRLLCRACNQRSAIIYFGLNKMDPRINGVVRSRALAYGIQALSPRERQRLSETAKVPIH